jgi:murein DD-endopeptidase MepM/ murein hydrolase activator NlpD
MLKDSKELLPSGIYKVFIVISLLVVILSNPACTRSFKEGNPSFWAISSQRQSTVTPGVIDYAKATVEWPMRRSPGAIVFTPTPDVPHSIPSPRTEPELYAVKAGDTLGQIANYYGVSLEQILGENELANPNVLEIGQVLTIPVPTPQERGPDFKIIPDSELVNGPYNLLFNVEEFVKQQSGYLASYHEEVGETSLNGAQIVQLVSLDYSVNPRLLLAVLQYQGGWLTNSKPEKADQVYPIGFRDPERKGLYRQLAWAANNLNRGYYLWRVNGASTWLLSDGNVVPIAPTINAGTAGIQQMFALLYDRNAWELAVSQEGLYATYEKMFGYPFDYTIEPLVPPGLKQPTLQLPFEPGVTWFFTSGPHGGWGDGSGWAALDFGPPGEALGCVPSDAWVVAAADGLIVRAENGAVIQDLDGDGFEQTGWVLLYMHVESRDRVKAGTYLKAGDRIGHPSCEGGVSSGTHLHFARRYNGEWIPADQDLPFVLDGWVSSGTGTEYDGFLTRGSEKVEAYAGNSANNGIQR